MKATANIGLLTVIILFTQCKNNRQNQLLPQEQQDGWVQLFDGNSTRGWHVYNKGTGNVGGWTVAKGELYCDSNYRKKTLTLGDLVTDEDYENFDLRFDYNIAHAGNSGVFINVVESPDVADAWASGVEFQLLDPAHPDFNDAKKKPGALFGLVPASDSASALPAGEWNSGRIVQENGRVSFYLNDVITLEQNLRDSTFKQAVAATWFKNYPGFAASNKGKIALQDWAKGVRFRNIKIRQL